MTHFIPKCAEILLHFIHQSLVEHNEKNNSDTLKPKILLETMALRSPIRTLFDLDLVIPEKDRALVFQNYVHKVILEPGKSVEVSLVETLINNTKIKKNQTLLATNLPEILMI